MKVKVCPDCDAHNSPDAWNCVQCGCTLSVNTLADVDHTQETPFPGEPTKGIIPDMKETVLHRSEDSLITNCQALIRGEVLHIHRIASVEKVVVQGVQAPQESESERRPRPEDILIGPGLAARAIRSLFGIGQTYYVLRIHLKSGRVHEYTSRSEKPVDVMLDALMKAIAYYG